MSMPKSANFFPSYVNIKITWVLMKQKSYLTQDSIKKDIVLKVYLDINGGQFHLKFCNYMNFLVRLKVLRLVLAQLANMIKEQTSIFYHIIKYNLRLKKLYKT